MEEIWLLALSAHTENWTLDMLFCNSTPELENVRSITALAVLSQENKFYTVGSMDSMDCLSVDSTLLSLLHSEAEGFESNLIF